MPADELSALGQLPDLAAVVLTGEGLAFCAGGDLPAIVKLVRQGPDAVADRLYRCFHGMIRAWRIALPRSAIRQSL